MATDLETVDAAIVSAASEGVSSVTSDGTTVTARSMEELIAAQKHIANQTAQNNGRIGIRMFKLSNPGAL